MKKNHFKKYLVIPLIVLLVFVSCSQTFEQNFDGNVLAFYKSSDGQTESKNEIYDYLSQHLNKLGLRVYYYDIDKGMPSESALKNIRAIISWFRNPAMFNPHTYLDFLNKAIDSGIKVVVFDNFGAYQNSRTKEYVDNGRINLTLSRLGLIYLGDWTEDPNIIQIDQKDEFVVEKEGSQNVKNSHLFYRFFSVDRNLKVYLSLKRKDRNYTSSPTIVTNCNGGFALSNYIYRIEDGTVKLLLNLKAFLNEALFPGPTQEKIGILVDTSKRSTSKILNYTTGVLKRAKLPFEIITKDQFTNLLSGDLRRFTVVGLILKDDAGLNPECIKTYLKEGGAVVALSSGNFKELASVLSMNSSTNAKKYKMGYKIRKAFLLGEELSLEDKVLEWSSGKNLPTQDAEILATDYKGETPLLWSAKRGNGSILCWNWDEFWTGKFQGFILESFLFLRPVGVATTAGLGLMFIDDWPLPMCNIVKKPLSIQDTRFYKTIWWNDIKNLFSKYGVHYCSCICFNYNNRTKPPFCGGEFYRAHNMVSVAVTEEILKSEEELGFHGYNHISLTTKRTLTNLHPWQSLEAIEQSLNEVKREWIGLFGEQTLPFAYVPPNNFISINALDRLKKVLPSIKVFAAIRTNDDNETTTKFGPHPTIPDLYCIPRTSWGYPFTSENRQLIVAAITGSGIWSHFIHPDDVYDKYRSSGLSWNELKDGLANQLTFIKQHYPWLRFVSVKDAHGILTELDSKLTEFRWVDRDSTLLIDSSPNMLVRIRLNDFNSIKEIAGAKIVYTYKSMPAYILETTKTLTHITFK